MRHLRITFGLAAAVCAFALAATPALAHEFISSVAGKTKGASEEEQKFKFGPFKITCMHAASAGLVAAGPSKTFGTSVKFARCTTEGKIGSHVIALGTTFKTPLAIEYHANGFVETGSEIEEVEGKAVLAGGTAEIKVNTGVKSKCTLYWPEQTIPLKAERKPLEEYSAATYTNEATAHSKSLKFPDGLQHTIVISNEFKGIKYEFEGEPCEEWGRQGGPEGGGGTYLGSFPELVSGGNLEFQ